ncbi:hypothetical protein Cni_G06956 [Canna indica]|uniref:Uncharacterized protein n=1 Tax=Canna indica TaxID=4628 RepID=A0AAQ3K1A3_9LILI|nr:hypothetical protein Cni_G06956 [Canna indica]
MMRVDDHSKDEVVIECFISTPVNAARAAAAAAARVGVSIDFVELPFPCAAVGLPDGCENLDLLPSLESHHVELFFSAAALLRDPLKQYLLAQPPSPTCMIADACNPWTRFVAEELRMPRLLFYDPSCLYTLCARMIKHHIIWDRYKDDPFEPFDVPGLPHPLRISMARMPWLLTALGWEGFLEEIVESEAKGKKVWTLGPLSLVHKDPDNKAARGNGVSIVGDEEHRVIRWLDEKPARSVIYLSFGSIVRHDAAQLMEISHGLEAAGRPFLWVIKEAEASSQEVEKCRLSGFEERTAGRGILITVVPLDHRAGGGRYRRSSAVPSSPGPGGLPLLPLTTWRSPIASSPAAIHEDQWHIVAAELSSKLLHITRKRDKALLEASRLKYSLAELELALKRPESHCRDLRSIVQPGPDFNPAPKQAPFPVKDFHLAVADARAAVRQLAVLRLRCGPDPALRPPSQCPAAEEPQQLVVLHGGAAKSGALRRVRGGQ